MSTNTLLSNASGFLNHGHKYTEIEMVMVPDYAKYIKNLMNRIFDEHSVSLVHEDQRRSIHEYNGEDFSIQQFHVHSSNIPLGNHYHKKAKQTSTPESDDIIHDISEIFVFDTGEWVLLLQDIVIDSVGNILEQSEHRQLHIWEGSVVVIPPMQAHTFFLEPGTQFRWFRPYPFDPADMDMNVYNMELPK